MKKKIALVCCRGGSKGIKRKNIKLFCRKPLLFWTFKNIEKSKIFDEIYLCTDDKEIASYGKNIGFKVPQLRPKYLAQDNSDVFDTHNFFFKKNNINNQNSLACIINNNPFITSQIIKKTFQKFKVNKFKNVTMCAKKINTDQIYFRQSLLKKTKLFPIFKKKLISSKINRQKVINTYVNIGDIRWGQPSQLISYKKFNIEICKNGYENLIINDQIYHDLNELKDWKIAELKFKNI